jgi:nucleoside-diphosphate-sugar epimerase
MILLTGGTGLIGRHTLDLLVGQGRAVLAMARSPASAAQLEQAGAMILAGDISDPSVWQRLDKVSAIIHCAASVFTRGSWDDYRRTNVEATRHAAARARTLGIPLIHVSSVAVYADGRVRPASVSESAPIGDPTSPEMYPRSKRLAEAEVWREAEEGLQTIVVRPCVVYGEGDRLFLPKLVKLAKRGWFPVVGKGLTPLPLVYAGNVAEGIVAALDAKEGWGQAYNLTNDGLVTGNDLVMALANGLRRPVKPRRVPLGLARVTASALDLLRPLAGAHLPPLRSGVAFLGGGNAYSSRAAIEVLGWRPSHRHSQALPRSVRWVDEGK